MSNYMSDLMTRTNAKTTTTNKAGTSTPYNPSTKNPGSTELDMDDFLQLIVAQFQNQDPENAASTSDMLNMMVQMTTIQSMTTMTDATTMLYTASLVGKEVTVGEFDKNGKLTEIVGTVTATGTYNGQPVVFVDGVSYSLTSIMAVGRLPEEKPPATDPDPDEKPNPDAPGEDDKDPPKTEGAG